MRTESQRYGIHLKSTLDHARSAGGMSSIGGQVGSGWRGNLLGRLASIFTDSMCASCLSRPENVWLGKRGLTDDMVRGRIMASRFRIVTSGINESLAHGLPYSAAHQWLAMLYLLLPHTSSRCAISHDMLSDSDGHVAQKGTPAWNQTRGPLGGVRCSHGVTGCLC
ncbi:hypothetical protein L202_07493 [Cryptococcus amylolentus CBS 6039]|uniref:Uncharacterized protein n=1 Tax=Cryptococcus amylolentus CBS 6039 TaxID=1295533 RepID=A0A1E3HCE4_9TREE|nr:hypothetical protein L202_07493 [Cryptococcus amylolentus CBS 6039]ODN74010.1 hypothetical protein L202_07493 [Cryptococcus amylolentus CBS 6039]